MGGITMEYEGYLRYRSVYQRSDKRLNALLETDQK